jgi:hypothetical protein
VEIVGILVWFLILEGMVLNFSFLWIKSVLSISRGKILLLAGKDKQFGSFLSY